MSTYIQADGSCKYRGRIMREFLSTDLRVSQQVPDAWLMFFVFINEQRQQLEDEEEGRASIIVAIADHEET